MAETKKTANKPAEKKTSTAKKSSTSKKTTKSTSTQSSKSTSAKTTTKKTEPAKTNTQKSTTSSTKKSSRSGNIRTWAINKLSFWCIGGIAIFYLIASVLAFCGIPSKVVLALQGIATALAICIVAYNAWKYVAHKQTVWKVLYFVLLLVVLMGIVIPLISL